MKKGEQSVVWTRYIALRYVMGGSVWKQDKRKVLQYCTPLVL
jgi:hypothetical protein